MRNVYGEVFKVEIFGESHSPEIGVLIESVPKGEQIDFAALQAFMDRRAPGRDPFSTPRKEPDEPQFISGFDGSVADGTTIRAIIRNTNTRSGDYEKDVPRPGHADWPARVKFGENYSFAGGGKFSGRLTAPLCIAGGIAKQILAKRGVEVCAQAVEIAGQKDESMMKEAILAAKAEGDSVGGIIECRITGMPVGIGEHMFYGMENRISQAVFAIPAVKGIEFGAGFSSARMKGSENNDEYRIVDGEVKVLSNNAGGILGGMTNGEPIVLRVAMKPTPSIFKTQKSIDFSTMRNVELNVKGRHDPCVVLRAVPCVEAACAIAALDALYSSQAL